MKYCSKHHANPDDAIFCNECGEKLFVSQKETKKCPTCNAENPIDAEYCHECGKRIFSDKSPKPLPITGQTTPLSNNKEDIIGNIVLVGIIAFVIFIIIGLIGEFVDLIRLIGLIFN